MLHASKSHETKRIIGVKYMPLDDLPGPKTTPARREETDPTMNPDVTVTSEIVVLIMALSSHDDAEHIRYDHVKETIKLFHK